MGLYAGAKAWVTSLRLPAGNEAHIWDTLSLIIPATGYVADLFKDLRNADLWLRDFVDGSGTGDGVARWIRPHTVTADEADVTKLTVSAHADDGDTATAVHFTVLDSSGEAIFGVDESRNILVTTNTRSLILPGACLSPALPADGWSGANTAGQYYSADSTARTAFYAFPLSHYKTSLEDVWIKTIKYVAGATIRFRLRSVGSVDDVPAYVVPDTDTWISATPAGTGSSGVYHLTGLPLSVSSPGRYFLEIEYMNNGSAVACSVISVGVSTSPEKL